jgi:tetratricopeptide (TPR) repeat protein
MVARMTSTQLSSSRAVLRWIECTQGIPIPTGLDRETAQRCAAELLESFRTENASRPFIEASDFFDVLHAVCGEMETSLQRGLLDLQVVRSAYQLALSLDLPEDEFGEKGIVLGRLAYFGWRQALAEQRLSQMLEWEHEAARQLAGQEPVLVLLQTPAADWTAEICQTFLGDRAVLLPVLSIMRIRVRTHSAFVHRQIQVMYDWLLGNGAEEPSTETRLFLGWAAYVAGFASLDCGFFDECRGWIDRAARWLPNIDGSQELVARTQHLRLALAYETRRYEQVLQESPQLVETAKRLGLPDLVAKGRFVEAVALKEVSRDAESRNRFELLLADPHVAREAWFSGLVLLNLAELEGKLGRYDSAIALVNQSRALMERQEFPSWAGHLHGISGEILRGQGKLDAACREYLRAADIYAKAEMASLAAYVRIILAETLIAAGRQKEAIAQIFAALPVIEQRSLVHEGVVAVALLRESLRRQKIDPRTLRELREYLDRSRREGRP